MSPKRGLGQAGLSGSATFVAKFAAVTLAVVVIAPAQADTTSNCPQLPAKVVPPTAVIAALTARFGPKPFTWTSPVRLLAKDASVGTHTCTPRGSTTPMSWGGVLPKGVASGWEILVTRGKRDRVATVAQINGHWRVIAVSTAPTVPFEPRIVTGPPATDFELRSSATVVCTWANSAQATLATDVGLKDAKVRRQHLTALAATIREITSALAKMAAVNPGTATQKRVAAARNAARRFAAGITNFLKVVPVATTAMDKKTVDAFGGLIDSRDIFSQRCATMWDGYK